MGAATLLHDDRDLGEQAARTSSSMAPPICGRSTSTFSNSSICRGIGRKPAFRWRCCRPTRRCAARSKAPAGASSIRARFRPSMASYQAFIAGSRGEFTVAKDIYARPNSGWFSDRAVCYLASGRPVVTMRTGFTSFCPVGRGLFDYATHEEALAAIDAIAADYPAPQPCRARTGRRIFRCRPGDRRQLCARPGCEPVQLPFFRAIRLDRGHAPGANDGAE